MNTPLRQRLDKGADVLASRIVACRPVAAGRSADRARLSTEAAREPVRCRKRIAPGIVRPWLAHALPMHPVARSESADFG
jgi:hypothetical protein